MHAGSIAQPVLNVSSCKHSIVVRIGGAETLGMAADMSADTATDTFACQHRLLNPLVLQGAC